MTRYFYPAIFHHEDIGYSVSFPDLQGCNTEGNSLEEAYEMALDALSLYLEGITEYPVPSHPKAIALEESDFIVIIEVNTKNKHSNKAVKKTLTIPQWLNELAEEKHVNFSGILQEALKKHLGVI